MKRLPALCGLIAVGTVPFILLAQDASLNPAVMNDLSTGLWPGYHGDYSGRHYSPLKQIDASNARSLSLAWIYRTTSSTQNAIVESDVTAAAAAAQQGRGGGGGGGGGFGGGAAAGPTIKSIPLVVGGMMYLSVPGHVYAVDARTGVERWHYATVGGAAIGNRGVGMYGSWLFLETGDNRIVSLDAQTGHERWHKDLKVTGSSNFSTSAPVIIRNHVIVGIGGDSGSGIGWVESLDPETGDMQWKWVVTPAAGEPGVETWPSPEAAAKGAGGPWQPPTYDPALNLMYMTTGQPTPTYNGRGRPGANLYTSCVVALNPDTGKMTWYYQFSPHDTHDWDATQVPVLIDGTINGQPRKLLAQANRNGYYFLLDRTNGKELVAKPFALSNTYKGLDATGTLIPDPDKEPSPGGSLVFPDSDGAANYPAPSFSPDTALFYVNATNAASIFSAVKDDTDPTGFARGSEYHLGLFDSSLLALDYRTGAVKWSHHYPQTGFWSSTYPGILTTAGGVLFTGDPSGNFIAYDDRSGRILWHAPVGATVSNSPETFLMDGKQYVVVAARDGLYCFYLQ